MCGVARGWLEKWRWGGDAARGEDGEEAVAVMAWRRRSSGGDAEGKEGRGGEDSAG
jgi:hypothetical protein